ncbi:class I SAM-dependent methyltransferase [Streptacidiphilus sp. EB129]|uniref:class I SAM-dependent methyltransferase n=1 Tax=Streptacidiphilus sp. EB129 TaxID=3156262 RepID=UPI0035183566
MLSTQRSENRHTEQSPQAVPGSGPGSGPGGRLSSPGVLSSPSIEALHETLGPQTGRDICDVGCGAGALALSFAAQRPSRLVGVDPADGVLRAFRAAAAEHSAVVEAVQASAEHLPFPDGEFDLVVSRLAASRFADPRTAAAEMARLLRPGGRLAVIDLEGHAVPGVEALHQELERLRDPAFRRSHTLVEWIRLLHGAGLNVPMARSRLAESRSGVSVARWCALTGSGTEAAASVRRRLSLASEPQLHALGIRRRGSDYLLPVRTCLVVGVKRATDQAGPALKP